MDRHRIEIHVGILHVDLHVGCGLGTVNHDLRPVIVGDLGDGLYGHGAAGHVAALGDGYELHGSVHLALEGFDIEHPVLPGHGMPHPDPDGIPQREPRDVVGVVLGIGGDHGVPLPQSEPEGHGVEGLGGVLGEDEGIRGIRVEERCQLLAGLVHSDGDLVRKVVDAPSPAYGEVAVVSRHSVDHRIGTEGLAGAVEIDTAVGPHRGEIAANGIEIHDGRLLTSPL